MKKKMKNPRIRNQYSLVAHSSNLVEIRNGVWNGESHLLKDNEETGHLLSILNLLNGEYSSSEVARKLSVARSTVEKVIDHLTQLQLLQYGRGCLLEEYAFNYKSTLSRYQSQISIKKKVILLGDSLICETIYSIISEIVPSNTIEYITDNENPILRFYYSDNSDFSDKLKFEKLIEPFENYKDHLFVYATTETNPVTSSFLNKIAYAQKIPVLYASMDGPSLISGPLFTGDSGPCYECFETRILLNMKQQAAYVKFKTALALGNYYTQKKFILKPFISILASHTSLEILNFITTENSFLKNQALTLYLPSMEFCYHTILKCSGCLTCGYLPVKDENQLYFDTQKMIGGVGGA